MPHVYVKYQGQTLEVHQILYACVLSIAYALMRDETTDSDAQRWQTLVELVEQRDDMGNACMTFPYEELQAAGQLDISELIKALTLALYWIYHQPDPVPGDAFRQLNTGKLYWRDVRQDTLYNTCEQLLGLFSRNHVRHRKGLATPKLILQFVGRSQPVQTLVTKFGGQPNWLQSPSWPVSPSTGNQMRFNFQIALDERIFPGHGGKMVYVFVSDAGEFWEVTQLHSKENAVIIQPNIGQDPSILVIEQATGPTLNDLDAFDEYTVETELACDEPGEMSNDHFHDAIIVPQIGGLPVFHENQEIELDDSWRLLTMLDSFDLPFFLRGYGPTYYVFINNDCTAGIIVAHNF